MNIIIVDPGHGLGGRHRKLVTEIPAWVAPSSRTRPLDVLRALEEGPNQTPVDFTNNVLLKAGFTDHQIAFLKEKFSGIQRKFTKEDFPLIPASEIRDDLISILREFSTRYSTSMFSTDKVKAMYFLASTRFLGWNRSNPYVAPGEIIDPNCWANSTVKTFKEGFKPFTLDELRPLRDTFNDIEARSGINGMTISSIEEILDFVFRQSSLLCRGKYPLTSQHTGQILMGTFYFPPEYRLDTALNGMQKNKLADYIPIGVVDVSNNLSNYQKSEFYKTIEYKLNNPPLGLFYSSGKKDAEVIGKQIRDIFYSLGNERLTREDAIAVLLFIGEKFFPRNIIREGRMISALERISDEDLHGGRRLNAEAADINPQSINKLNHAVYHDFRNDDLINPRKLGDFVYNTFLQDDIKDSENFISMHKAASVVVLTASCLDKSKQNASLRLAI